MSEYAHERVPYVLELGGGIGRYRLGHVFTVVTGGVGAVSRTASALDLP